MVEDDLYYLKYEEDRIKPLAREIWGENILEIYNKLNDREKDKFLKIAFFYYWRCYKIRQRLNDLDEGLIFVIVVSAIEALISTAKHKNFFEWYKSECINKNLSIEELWEAYLLEHGAGKKFVYFWQNFVDEIDKNKLEEDSWFMPLREGAAEGKRNMTIKKISNILYRLRSEFVHQADTVPIANPSNPDMADGFMGSGFSLGNDHYFLATTMDKLVSIFEKGFEKYFKKETEMKIIKKKIWREYFELVKVGKKRFELRAADFDVKEGDILILEEWDPDKKEYTGRRIEKKVDYILNFKLDDFGQKKDIEEKGLNVIQFEN